MKPKSVLILQRFIIHIRQNLESSLRFKFMLTSATRRELAHSRGWISNKSGRVFTRHNYNYFLKLFIMWRRRHDILQAFILFTRFITWIGTLPWSHVISLWIRGTTEELEEGASKKDELKSYQCHHETHSTKEIWNWRAPFWSLAGIMRHGNISHTVISPTASFQRILIADTPGRHFKVPERCIFI